MMLYVTAVSLRYLRGHLDTHPGINFPSKRSVATYLATVRSLGLLCSALRPINVDATCAALEEEGRSEEP